MKLLLDTFIWWDEDPARLSAEALNACSNSTNQLALSIASVWEMQIKASLGKLRTRKPLRQILLDQVQQNRLDVLPVRLDHVLNLDSLPQHHKDPFDRLIVSTAIVEGFTLVSHDPAVAQYPVPRIW